MVVEEVDGHWYLAGLTSNAMCGNSNESIYTDMAKYVHMYCRTFMKLTTTFRYVFWLSEVVDDGYGPTTVTTGMPMGDCFETGSCDISGISI